MKQYLFLFAAAVVMFSFSSCKKDYTCQCAFGNGAKFTPIVIHNTKGNAKDECESWGVGVAGQGNATTCKLL